MAPILELIKKNAVPVNVMRSAARGALPLPADETLEVLVYMAQHPLFGQDARMTLAGWEPQSALDVLSKDTAAPEVLLYYWQPENRRPVLMPALIENPAIPEDLLMELAETASRETVKMLLASVRARNTPGVIEALLGNANLTPVEAQELQGGHPEPEGIPQQPAEMLEEFDAPPEAVAALQTFQHEHASEIAAEEGKPFELVKDDEPAAEAAPAELAARLAEEAVPEEQIAPAVPAAATVTLVPEELPLEDSDEFEVAEKKKLTVFQRVSKLNVGQRIKLGFIGGKEERALLIRDTARLVQNAVLNSPKLSDAEAEAFAGSKNLQENVFREIARQRRFLKLYPVVRNLVNNPRCPLDISLTLVKTLQVYDLKSLRHNKNVPDTIRKVAQKLYTEKATRGGAKKE
ncbi:MAG TPA: hypothetical protein VGQ12_00895 [Candidatus Angelobacter sp.]|jgi:hypothetical protein|nr:hypothetical protein [Candidatus Angelobacter sp.]